MIAMQIEVIICVFLCALLQIEGRGHRSLVGEGWLTVQQGHRQLQADDDVPEAEEVPDSDEEEEESNEDGEVDTNMEERMTAEASGATGKLMMKMKILLVAIGGLVAAALLAVGLVYQRRRSNDDDDDDDEDFSDFQVAGLNRNSSRNVEEEKVTSFHNNQQYDITPPEMEIPTVMAFTLPHDSVQKMSSSFSTVPLHEERFSFDIDAYRKNTKNIKPSYTMFEDDDDVVS